MWGKVLISDYFKNSSCHNQENLKKNLIIITRPQVPIHQGLQKHSSTWDKPSVLCHPAILVPDNERVWESANTTLQLCCAAFNKDHISEVLQDLRRAFLLPLFM